MIFPIHVEEAVCHEENGFCAFQDICPVTGHELFAKTDAFDGPRNESRSIAPPAVVGRGNEGIGRFINGQAGINGDGQRFMGFAAAPQGGNTVL